MKLAQPSSEPQRDSSGGAVRSAASRWDRLGIYASVACAFHCLVAPLLFLAVPTLAGIWDHPSSHAVVALLVLPLASTVLLRGYRVHRKRWIAVTAVLGAVCILLGSVMPFLGGEEIAARAAESRAGCCSSIVLDESGGISLGWTPASISTLVGSALLVACHLGNLACCRRCAVRPRAP